MLGSIEVTFARLTSRPLEDGKDTAPDVVPSLGPNGTRLSGAGLSLTSSWEFPVMRGVNRQFAKSSTWVTPRREWEMTALKMIRV